MSFIKSNPFKLILLWAVWLVIILAFQWLGSTRISLQAPDYSQSWTSNETQPGSQSQKPYLSEPLLNNQVAWDSEFYLSIALKGYDDPMVFNPETPEGRLALNYAFFPFYSVLIKIVSAPFIWLGLAPIAAASLAGVLISALGTLGACFALYFIFKKYFPQHRDPLQASFFFLIFPTSFFLCQVYTEGLFCGLAFGAIALAQNKKFLLATIFTCAAVFTRAVGIALLLPLFFFMIKSFDWKEIKRSILKAWKLVYLLLPILSLFIWNLILGHKFHLIESHAFHRGLFSFEDSITGDGGWASVFSSLGSDNSHALGHNVITILLTLIAIGTIIYSFRISLPIALFSAVAFLIAFFSGSAQSITRYILVLPSIYLVLGKFGQSPLFEKGFSIFSILLLALLSLLFTANFWVA